MSPSNPRLILTSLLLALAAAVAGCAEPEEADDGLANDGANGDDLLGGDAAPEPSDGAPDANDTVEGGDANDVADAENTNSTSETNTTTTEG